MRKPKTKDDYWYTQVINGQPPKVYRECPKCGMRVAIPVTYSQKLCYMCHATIYQSKTKNEKAKRKYKFLNELKKKGIKVND